MATSVMISRCRTRRKQSGSTELNGIYILDPQEADAEERIKLVTVLAWHSDFGLVPCGDHIDTHPIVVGETRFAKWITAAMVLVVTSLLYLIWKWLVPG